MLSMHSINYPTLYTRAVIGNGRLEQRRNVQANRNLGDDQIQAQLEGCKPNQDIFAKISSELSKEGYERTTQQCRDKIKKLKVELS